MDILIKDTEMPTEYPLWIVVSADGTVQYNYFNEWQTAEEKAVSVPPHGRLIDADALEDSFEPSDFWNPDAEDNCFAAVRIVHSAPTVIPASEEKMK